MAAIRAPAAVPTRMSLAVGCLREALQRLRGGTAQLVGRARGLLFLAARDAEGERDHRRPLEGVIA